LYPPFDGYVWIDTKKKQSGEASAQGSFSADGMKFESGNSGLCS